MSLLLHCCCCCCVVCQQSRLNATCALRLLITFIGRNRLIAGALPDFYFKLTTIEVMNCLVQGLWGTSGGLEHSHAQQAPLQSSNKLTVHCFDDDADLHSDAFGPVWRHSNGLPPAKYIAASLADNFVCKILFIVFGETIGHGNLLKRRNYDSPETGAPGFCFVCTAQFTQKLKYKFLTNGFQLIGAEYELKLLLWEAREATVWWKCVHCWGLWLECRISQSPQLGRSLYFSQTLNKKELYNKLLHSFNYVLSPRQKT